MLILWCRIRSKCTQMALIHVHCTLYVSAVMLQMDPECSTYTISWLKLGVIVLRARPLWRKKREGVWSIALGPVSPVHCIARANQIRESSHMNRTVEWLTLEMPMMEWPSQDYLSRIVNRHSQDVGNSISCQVACNWFFSTLLVSTSVRCLHVLASFETLYRGPRALASVVNLSSSRDQAKRLFQGFTGPWSPWAWWGY